MALITNGNGITANLSFDSIMDAGDDAFVAASEKLENVDLSDSRFSGLQAVGQGLSQAAAGLYSFLYGRDVSSEYAQQTQSGSNVVQIPQLDTSLQQEDVYNL